MRELKGKKLEYYKETLSLSGRQREILIGSLLGDECLRFAGRCRNATLSVSHGGKQKEYVFWKYKEFKEWVLTPPWMEDRIYHKDTSRTLISWKFQTVSHKEFTRFYHLFYRDSRKILPDKIKEMLNSPLSLAVWIMDDGNKNRNSLFLNTQNFTLTDQKRLAKVLNNNFGTDVRIDKHSISKGRQLYRIRFPPESTRRLYRITKGYILPIFRYKFPLYPRND